MPSTSASMTWRPELFWVSAKAITADATGPAGWMMVLRWVSSKSKVCEEMPLIKAALAMSTRSERPASVAWGAGESMFTAAKADSTASCFAAPIAQPSQFKNVRWASCSTVSLQPWLGCSATNWASCAVMGGALWSAATAVLMVMCSPVRLKNQASRLILRSRAKSVQRARSFFM